MKKEKSRKEKGRQRSRYLISAFLLVALIGAGCGKEEGEEANTLTETPYPTVVSPSADAPTGTADGQDGKNTGATQEGDFSQTGKGDKLGSDSSDESQTGDLQGRKDASQTGETSGEQIPPQSENPWANITADFTVMTSNAEEEKEEELGKEPWVTPVKNLEPGQHFIFVRETTPTRNFYKDVWIYDENWNCSASFGMAYCTEDGVTDARYISIDRQGEGMCVYDLEEGEFVDFSGIASGKVAILDDKKGYFKSYNPSGAEVIDRDGNVLLDWVPYLEEDVLLYREENSYCARYKSNDLDGNIGGIEKIYDLDFHLKTILYEIKEDMPPEKERLDGVGYLWEGDGCVLSREGDVLLCPEIFLNAFGDGSDTECVIEDGKVVWEQMSWEKRLYKVSYAGQTWYVDDKCGIYFKEGDGKLTILDAGQAGGEYYAAQVGWEWKYFLPDGSPIMPKYVEMEPDYTGICEDGSYVTARKTEQGYMVEMVVPKKDGEDYQINEYESSLTNYSKIKYLEPYVIMLGGSFTGEDGEKQNGIVIYKGSHLEVFTAKRVYIEQIRNWRTDQYEDVWLVTMDNSNEQIQTKGSIEHTYAIVKEGKLRFTTPVLGELVGAASHDGYLQISAGNYTYVYDYAGHQIIKACNGVIAEE